MSQSLPNIGVIHLVRAGNGVAPLERFLASYAENPGGIEHDLIIVFKGFAEGSEELRECGKALEGVRHLAHSVDDGGFDIGTYLKAYRRFDHDCFCFLNSFSVIQDERWLQKMHSHLVADGVGLVGASGSYQSIYSGQLMKVMHRKPPRRGPLFRFGRRSFAELVRGIKMDLEPYRGVFPRFPNHHIRTNAFMIARCVLEKIECSDLQEKLDVYRFESGVDSLTCQVMRMGLDALVVGKDGQAYGIGDWMTSGTFWSGGMENLLVADNQTMQYSEGDDARRKTLYQHAWIDPLDWIRPGREDLTMFCPLCTKKRASRLFKTLDHNRHKGVEVFDYYRCRRCRYVYLHPVPEDLSKYYGDEYYQIPSTLEEILPGIENHEKYKIDIIQRFARGDRLLEIGPALGGALHFAKEAGFKVEAIEMDSRCCAFMRDILGIRAIESNSAHEVLRTSTQVYDVIAAWHVIEHLPNYVHTLEAAVDRLAPGGILVLAAPNPDSLQFKMFRKYWTHLDAPRHVSLIPLDLLRLQAISLGMEMIWSTTTDAGGRMWNTFGWQHSWANILPSTNLVPRRPRKAARRLARISETVFRSAEVACGMGAAYTAVFRKAEP